MRYVRVTNVERKENRKLTKNLSESKSNREWVGMNISDSQIDSKENNFNLVCSCCAIMSQGSNTHAFTYTNHLKCTRNAYRLT